MPQKIIKLNGMCSALNNLTGVSFSLIHSAKEINPPVCSEKQFCKKNNFDNQRIRCQDLEREKIYRLKDQSFRIHEFSCGLCEFMMPVFKNGSLSGVILTNKVKKDDSSNRNEPAGPLIPRLASKQLTSFVSLLNYSHGHFKEIVAVYQGAPSNSKDKILIHRAKNLIEKNYHQPKLPLKNVAREIYTSYFYLCRLFKKELNLTFTHYVTLLRLRSALKLLQNLNLSVAQVSYAAGFSDSQYFNRVFKKTLHCTPTEYRSGSIDKKEAMRQKVSSLLS